MSDPLPPDVNDLPPDPEGLPHDGWAAVEVDHGGSVFGRVTEYDLADAPFVRIDFQVQNGAWYTLFLPGHRLREVLFKPEAEVRKLAKKVNKEARRLDAKDEFESD